MSVQSSWTQFWMVSPASPGSLSLPPNPPSWLLSPSCFSPLSFSTSSPSTARCCLSSKAKLPVLLFLLLVLLPPRSRVIPPFTCVDSASQLVALAVDFPKGGNSGTFPSRLLRCRFPGNRLRMPRMLGSLSLSRSLSLCYTDWASQVGSSPSPPFSLSSLLYTQLTSASHTFCIWFDVSLFLPPVTTFFSLSLLP